MPEKGKDYYKNMGKLASIVIVTYNSVDYIGKCIESITKQNYPHEIIIVDNCSQDGTATFINDNFPSVKLIESLANKGYGAGNNLGIKHAKGEYIVILNPDTIVEQSWLEELIKPLIISNKVITTSKILTYNGSLISACGINNHITGLAFPRGFGYKPNAFMNQEFVSGLSGCSFAIKKSNIIELGGFDENLFMYHDDVDLSWRALLNGYQILYISRSVVKHSYNLHVPPNKIYNLEKGRYIVLRKYLSKKQVIMMFPSLLITEILTFGYALINGREGIRYKVKAVKDGLTLRVDKIDGDKVHLLLHLNYMIPVDQLTYNALERILKVLANYIFKLNYRLLDLVSKGFQ